jgi:hypothetical protein
MWREQVDRWQYVSRHRSGFELAQILWEACTVGAALASGGNKRPEVAEEYTVLG